jgi:hypothetical protein
VRSLSDIRWITLKGFLFLLLGFLSSFLIFAERPQLKVALLLILAIWSFCRFYYFAFYVVSRYVDADYRFTGLGSFVLYWLQK